MWDFLEIILGPLWDHLRLLEAITILKAMKCNANNLIQRNHAVNSENNLSKCGHHISYIHITHITGHNMDQNISFVLVFTSHPGCSLSRPGKNDKFDKHRSRRFNTGFGIWDLPQKSSTKAKFGTKLGLIWDHFYTLLGLLFVIFIKML